MKTETKKTTKTPGEGTQPTTEQLRRVPLKLIDPSPFQNRKTFKTPDWAEFVGTVRTSGVIQPGVGREVNGRIELVCGERRFRASAELELPDMPLIIRPLSDQQVTEMIAIENLQRENLNELEEAQGYADWLTRLTTTAWNDTEKPQFETRKAAIEYIESRVGRKRATIYERLRLLELNADERELFTSGKINASVASLLPTIPNPKDRQAYLEELEQQLDYGNAPSVREVQEDIEDRFSKPLRASDLDLDALYEVPAGVKGEAGVYRGAEGTTVDATVARQFKLTTLVSCAACSLRTGNMLDQFPELAKRPNVCTKPGCLKLKIQLAAALKAQAAAAKGKVTLTAKEYRARKGEFLPGNKSIQAQNRWGSDLTECMGKHAPDPVLVPTSDGLVKVYPKEEAVAAMKKNGVKFSAERKEKEMSPAEREKAEQERKAAMALREQLVKTHSPRAAAYLNKLSEKAAWELVLEELVDKWGRNKGPLIGKTAREKVLAYVFNRRKPIYYNGDWDTDGCKLWQTAGVDFKAEEQKAKVAEKAKAQRLENLKGGDMMEAFADAGMSIAEGFQALTEVAKAKKLKDYSDASTEPELQALLKAFKAAHPAKVKLKVNSKGAKGAKPTKTKKGKK